MSRKTFDAGDAITLQASFAQDPDDVTITVERPDGTEEDLTPTSPSAGVYEATVVPENDEFGRWWWRVRGTGDVQARGERLFMVRRPRV